MRFTIYTAVLLALLLPAGADAQQKAVRTHCYSTMAAYEAVNPYVVAAKDEWSVVVIGSHSNIGKQITHIHFEGDHYWIYLGSSGIREFFKRVSGKTGSATKTGNLSFRACGPRNLMKVGPVTCQCKRQVSHECKSLKSNIAECSFEPGYRDLSALISI